MHREIQLVGFDLQTSQGVKWRNRLYKSPRVQEQQLIKVSRNKAHLCKNNITQSQRPILCYDCKGEQSWED